MIANLPIKEDRIGWGEAAFIVVYTLFLNVPLAGLVASKLWAWFVVPTWAAPALHWSTAAGTLLLVGLVRGMPKTSRKSPIGDTIGWTIALFLLWWAGIALRSFG